MVEYQYKESYNRIFKICKTTIEKKKYNISDLQYNNGYIKAIRPLSNFSKSIPFSIIIRNGYKTKVSIYQESNNVLSWIKNRIFEYQLIKAIKIQLSIN